MTTKMKTTKIVYAYDMYRDQVQAVHVYTPCDDGNHQVIVDADDCAWVKHTVYYTGPEWEQLLYNIKEAKADVKIVRAIDEIRP